MRTTRAVSSCGTIGRYTPRLIYRAGPTVSTIGGSATELIQKIAELGSRFRERQHGLLQDPDELIFPVLGDQWTGRSPALQHASPHTTATPELPGSPFPQANGTDTPPVPGLSKAGGHTPPSTPLIAHLLLAEIAFESALGDRPPPPAVTRCPAAPRHRPGRDLIPAVDPPRQHQARLAPLPAEPLTVRHYLATWAGSPSSIATCAPPGPAMARRPCRSHFPRWVGKSGE